MKSPLITLSIALRSVPGLPDGQVRFAVDARKVVSVGQWPGGMLQVRYAEGGSDSWTLDGAEADRVYLAFMTAMLERESIAKAKAPPPDHHNPDTAP